MFKFNFNIDENNENENLNVKEEENCLTNQEFGWFDIEDLQSIVLFEKRRIVKNELFR